MIIPARPHRRRRHLSRQQRLDEIASLIELIEGQQHRDSRFEMSIRDARKIYRLATRPAAKDRTKRKRKGTAK